MAARQSKVIAWQEKLALREGTPSPSAKPAGADVIVKIVLGKTGIVKTMKFPKATFTFDVIERVCRNQGMDSANVGLYRRSGLRLEEDLTLEELDVCNEVRILSSSSNDLTNGTKGYSGA